MNAPHRNGPCPCGSGRKYKNCCMEKDQAAQAKRNTELKNTFRNEVEKLTEEDLLRIGQEALMSQLTLQVVMHERDKRHLTESCKILKSQISKLRAMQPLDGINAIITNLEQQIKGIEGAINQTKPTWAQRIYLGTLMQVADDREKMKAQPVALEPDPDDNEKELSPAVAKKVSAGVKFGPIKTDEDEEDNFGED